MKEIMRFDGTAQQYVEKLKYTLSARRESGRFPDDEEFGTAFTTRNVYQMKSKKHYYENANANNIRHCCLPFGNNAFTIK